MHPPSPSLRPSTTASPVPPLAVVEVVLHLLTDSSSAPLSRSTDLPPKGGEEPAKADPKAAAHVPPKPEARWPKPHRHTSTPPLTPTPLPSSDKEVWTPRVLRSPHGGLGEVLAESHTLPSFMPATPPPTPHELSSNTPSPPRLTPRISTSPSFSPPHHKRSISAPTNPRISVFGMIPPSSSSYTTAQDLLSPFPPRKAPKPPVVMGEKKKKRRRAGLVGAVRRFVEIVRGRK